MRFDNIKTRLKKATALSLSALTLLTSPLQAYAAGGMEGNAGGSSGTGVVTSTGGDFGCNISADPTQSMGRIGIRLSLVDRNDPSKVLSLTDDGQHTRVVDLLYTSKLKYLGFISGGWFTGFDEAKSTMFSSVKTQQLMSQSDTGAPQIKQYYFDDVFATAYKDAQGNPKKFKLADMKPWMVYSNNSYNATGEEFVEWCKSDDNNVQVIGDDGQLIFSSITRNVFGILTIINRVVDTTNNTISAEIQNGLSTELVQFPGNATELAEEIDTQLSELEAFSNNTPGSDEDLQELYTSYATVKENIDSLYSMDKSKGQSYKSRLEQLEAVFESKYEAFPNGSNAAREEYIRDFQEASGSPYNPETSMAANEQLDSLQGEEGATSSTSASNVGEAHIQQLLTLKEGDHYLLQTQSMIDNNCDISGATEDWVLLVEPIIYLTICHAGSMGTRNDRVMDYKLYGTVTNIMDAFVSEKFPQLNAYSTKRNFNWKMFKEVWWPLYVANDGVGFKFNNGFTLRPIEGSGLVEGKEYMPKQLHENRDVGWGVNVYWDLGGTQGRTWDEPTPEPAAPPASQKVTPEQGIKVVKWYVSKVTVNGKKYEVVTDVIVDDNHPRNIKIENEGVPGEGYFYLVEKWATGKDEILPDHGDTDTTFEQYHKRNPGEQGDLQPSTITVGDNDKVLYVKLVQYDWLTPGEIDVVKVKEPSNGGTPIIEHDTTNPGTTYPAGNEEGWKYVEDIQTPEPEVPVTKWPDVPTNGTPGNTPDIPVRDDTETIYIHYTDEVPEEEATPPGTMILYQNELSYGYDLRDLTQNGVLAGLKDYFRSPKPLTTSAYCSGHWCSNHDTDHYRSATKRINDRRYSLSVSSSNTAPNFILDWAEKDGSWYLSKSNGRTSSFYTSQLFPNADFILYRDRNQDLVTLYPGKNSSTKGELSRMGITAESYTPATHRIGSTGSGKFYATYQTNFAHDSDYDNELSWTWRDSRGCTASGTWNSTEVEGKKVSDLNATYSNSNNTEFRYELGQANTASAAPSETIDQTFTNVFANNTDVTVAQDGKLDFYPYIKMKLNNKSNNASDVYVTSTNLSSMPAYTKIEAGLWKGNAVDSDSANGNNPTPNVNLTSTQWSTHASSLEFISDNDIDDKNTVLPGGAIFDVDMKRNTSAQWTGEPGDTPTTSTKLGYRIWQTCVPDELASALAPGSNAPTVSEAKNQVTAFDESVKNSVANYGLVQAVAKGITPYNGYLKNFVGDSAYQYAYNGASWMNITLSEDTKYYLKLVAPNSGDGKLDTSVSNFGVHKGGLVTQIEYKVAADADGNVTVYRNNTPIKTINKTQGVEVLLADAEIKRVDDATKAVTNFVAALDRNLGYDRQNATWYNEAFDGITVLYSYLSYDIGLGDGSTGVISGEAKSVPVRTAVQDTFLSGVLENRADLYNFKSDSENKVRSSMILTGEYTDGGVSYPSGNLGALTTKNGTTMQITLPNMMLFAYSKMWYIPNANVTDLN